MIRNFLLSSSGMTPLRRSNRLSVKDVPLPPELGRFERGIIVTPRLRFTPNGMQQYDGFDPLVVRGAALLFDRLHWPHNNLITPGLVSDLIGDFEWVTESILRFQGSVSSNELHQMLIDAVVLTYGALEKREPGLWSISRTTQEMHFPLSEMKERMGLKLKFENALPIPTRETPLEDVFEFRERRKDNLTELRHYLEDLAGSVESSNFDGGATTVATEKFALALRDFDRAMSETFKDRISTNVEIKFNMAAAYRGVLTGATTFFNGASLTAAITAGATTTISGQVTAGQQRSTKKAVPFSYLIQAHQGI